MLLPPLISPFFFFNDPAPPEIYTLSLHDALPISISPIPQGRTSLAPVAADVHSWALTKTMRETPVADRMRAARLHEPGQPFRIDRIDRPQPRPQDALIQVKACGIIPNMNAIVSGKLWHHLPPLPAVMGLDAAGIVVKAPDGRSPVAVGDRVYVNPFLACGVCHYCRNGTPLLCADAALRGYFGFTPKGAKLLEDYPYGGLCELITAAPDSLVTLPDTLTFAQGARFGYLCTSFAALRRGSVGAGSWIAINGITGTLGVGAVMLALAMGGSRILGWGRNRRRPGPPTPPSPRRP